MLQLLSSHVWLVTLGSKLLLITAESLLIRVSLVLEPLIILILMLENCIRLSNLLKACGLRKVLSNVVKLLRLTVAFLWTLLLLVFTSAYGTINLLCSFEFGLR